MKTLTILLSMLTLLTFSSYSQNADVKKLLDKQETRTEIFNSIVGSHELMTEFMNVMRNDEHASMMMKKEQHQMGEMKSDQDMKKMKSTHEMMGNENMMKMMDMENQSEKKEHNHQH